MTEPTRCELCGQPVELVSSDEGTSYYRGLAQERIAELEDALQFYANSLRYMTRFDAYGAFTADILEDAGMHARQVLRAEEARS